MQGKHKSLDPLEMDSSNASAPPLLINLGIDFGTTYTKICYRDLGTEESQIITFSGNSLEAALVPSVVVVDDYDNLSLPNSTTSTQNCHVCYLKMGLTDPNAVEIWPPNRSEEKIRDKAAIKALSSWYLGTVVSKTRKWIHEYRGDLLRGRSVRWSANIGVPVEHYDSPEIDTFHEVLRVAWAWGIADDDRIPSDLSTAIERYKEDVSTASGPTDFHAVPEIAAAIQSFVSSREAVPNKYIYFDIGGGTMDGVAFRFFNIQGRQKINFLSSNVNLLGASEIESRISRMKSGTIENLVVRNILEQNPFEDFTHSEEKVKECINDLRSKVQQFVAGVVWRAKQKEAGRDWLEESFEDSPLMRNRHVVRPNLLNLEPLIVFVGGGGASSKWYLDAIHSTHEDFQHIDSGIPCYELSEVPMPSDLDLNGLVSNSYRRFAIAYGLSFAVGQGPEFRLPSQVDSPPISGTKVDTALTPRDKEIT